MQFLAAASVLMALSTAGCIESVKDKYKSDVDRTFVMAQTPERQVASVGPLASHPWKLGQWATYRLSEQSYETISVVAIDTCGTWISDDIKTYSSRNRWLICMRTPEPDESPLPINLVQVAVAQWNDWPAIYADFRARHDPGASDLRASAMFNEMLERVMPAAWHGDTSLRETIQVPAGRFEMAVRSADLIGQTPATRWSHPDVPFEGTVWIKSEQGKTTYVLVAYGETGTPSIVPDLLITSSPVVEATQRGTRPRYRDYVAMGGTSSWYTGLAGEQSTSATGLEVQDGIAMTSGLDIVPGLASSSLDHYSPDPTLRESSLRFTFGIHWRPFAMDIRPRAVSLENLYVLADLGYARLDRGMGATMDEVTSGFVAGAGVGWTWRATRGLGLSAEVSDHALFFTNDDITAHNLAASLLVDVYPFWR